MINVSVKNKRNETVLRVMQYKSNAWATLKEATKLVRIFPKEQLRKTRKKVERKKTD